MFLTNSSSGLERAWYAVATSDEVADRPIAVQLLGRRWVLVRLAGTLTAMEDRCPHRLAPLSIGNVCGARLQCRYHGWEVPDAEYLPPHEVTVDGVRGSTTYHISYKNSDDPLVATGEHPLVQPQVLYKEFAAVSNALIRLDHPLTGKRIAILFALQPEHDGSTRIFKQMARNDFAGDATKIAESIVFEAFHEMGVHLDLRREVHTRTDKLSVAYRRMLAAFVAGSSELAPDPTPDEVAVTVS